MSIEINLLEVSAILVQVVLGRTLHAVFAWLKKKTYKDNGLDSIGIPFKRLTALAFLISLVALNLRTPVFRDATHRPWKEATTNEILLTA